VCWQSPNHQGTTKETLAPVARWGAITSSADGAHLVAGALNGGIYRNRPNGSIVVHTGSSLELTYIGENTFFLTDFTRTIEAP
jgi:hypothetical protein